jgi:Uma2 family endonuclease
MAYETFALWGVVVPDVGPMTADELLAMGDKGRWCELVDGVLIRMSPTGFERGAIVGELTRALASYIRSQGLGVVAGAETGFNLTRPGHKDTVLAADVAFVHRDHVPPRGDPDRQKYLHVAPDLVAEVASPDQHKPDMAAKARVYLDSGVRLVWIVWPSTRNVDVWRPGSDAPITTLTAADSLEGLDVVPGFVYPLADLFS